MSYTILIHLCVSWGSSDDKTEIVSKFVTVLCKCSKLVRVRPYNGRSNHGDHFILVPTIHAPKMNPSTADNNKCSGFATDLHIGTLMTSYFGVRNL